jgi:hypothetical protein
MQVLQIQGNKGAKMGKGERIKANRHPIESKMGQVQRTVFGYFAQHIMQCRSRSRYAMMAEFDLEMDQLGTFGDQSCKPADGSREVDDVTNNGNFLQARETI